MKKIAKIMDLNAKSPKDKLFFIFAFAALRFLSYGKV